MKQVNEELLMRHNKDEMMTIMQSLYKFSDKEDYRNNLKILIEYLEDTTNLMLRYKEVAEQSSKTLSQVASNFKGLVQSLPQDHKKKQG